MCPKSHGKLMSARGRAASPGEAWVPAPPPILPASPRGEAEPHPSGFAVWVRSPGCPQQLRDPRNSSLGGEGAACVEGLTQSRASHGVLGPDLYKDGRRGPKGLAALPAPASVSGWEETSKVELTLQGKGQGGWGSEALGLSSPAHDLGKQAADRHYGGGTWTTSTLRQVAGATYPLKPHELPTAPLYQRGPGLPCSAAYPRPHGEQGQEPDKRGDRLKRLKARGSELDSRENETERPPGPPAAQVPPSGPPSSCLLLTYMGPRAPKIFQP